MNKTNSQTSFAGKIPIRKSVIIILVILAITIGHFVTQISFIESENKRTVESLAKSEPVIKLNKTEVAESKTQPPETTPTDEVLSANPPESPKEVQPVKIGQKESRRQTETAPPVKTLKKEAKGESKAERLRRAEKLLTGF